MFLSNYLLSIALKSRWNGVGQASCNDDPILDLHNNTHLGVDKTFYMAKRLLPHVSKENVRDVVRNCDICKSIDPAAITWSRGSLSVQSNLSRIAIDVTHFRSCCYLSLVDCGPLRYADWRFLKNESAGEICGVFAKILCDFGPPDEIVADNGASFRSNEFLKLLELSLIHI